MRQNTNNNGRPLRETAGIAPVRPRVDPEPFDGPYSSRAIPPVRPTVSPRPSSNPSRRWPLMPPDGQWRVSDRGDAYFEIPTSVMATIPSEPPQQTVPPVGHFIRGYTPDEEPEPDLQ